MNLNQAIKYPLPMKISGVGRYLPKRAVSSAELETKCGLPSGWCERKQGVRERRWIEDETISQMAAEAAREAVTDAGLTLSEIDLIFNASNSFDRVIPDQSVQIQQELGLGNSGIACLSANSGCLSFLVALDLSANLLAVGRFRNIVIVSALASSPGISFDNPVVCTMLGDGAAAVVVTKTPAGEPSMVHAARMETYSRAVDVSGFSGDAKRKTMFSKDVAAEDFSFEFDPQSMQAAGVKYNQNFMAKLWPANRELVKIVIPNQATRFTIDMMKFTFPAQKIMSVIDRFGNIGAVGYPMGIYEAVRDQRIGRGDVMVLHGMGAGFSVFGMVLTY